MPEIPHHERIADPLFRRAVDLLDAGDARNLRSYLNDHPQLVHHRVSFGGGNYFGNPPLLAFVAENPIRRETLPANIVEVAQVILDAGAKDDKAALDETLGLVASGQMPRECGVQVALIDLLCRYGADPGSAMVTALVHREFEAVDALIRNGAQVDLAAAAGLGRTEDIRLCLRRPIPRSCNLRSRWRRSLDTRMPRSSCWMQAPIRPLYNPSGAHGHSTPLHQAAVGGHLAVVRLLVERGAPLDTKDTLWHGTPAGWAAHAHKAEVEHYLRDQEQARKKKIP